MNFLPFSKVIAFLITLCVINVVSAQTPQYYKCCGTATSTMPFQAQNSATRVQLWYNPADFNTTPRSGQIERIYFRSSAAGQTGEYRHFRILMKQPTSSTQFQALAGTNALFDTALTLVHNFKNQKITGAAAGSWYSIELEKPYMYDSTKPLIVEISHIPPFSGSGLTNTATSASLLKKLYGGIPDTTGTINSLGWDDFGMDVNTTACSPNNIIAGIATADVSGTTCIGKPVVLSLMGNTSGIGQSYTWQSAPFAAGPYTQISAPSSGRLLQVFPAVTTWYRAIVSCGGQSAVSQPVQVSVYSGLSAGNYTINSTQPTAGNNFQSFADATAALSCGIAGPVVINVVPNTGPYTERVVIPHIGGTSPVNTVKIFGNNNTVIYNNTNHADIGVVSYMGCEWVTIEELVINATGSHARGVSMLSAAKHNTLKNCIVNSVALINNNTTYGISIGSSPYFYFHDGCDSNLLTGNTINGGFNAISAGYNFSQNIGNVIEYNIITNFLHCGIASEGDRCVIKGNNISRQSIFQHPSYGIRSSASRVEISQNRIHDMIYNGTSVNIGIQLFESNITDTASVNNNLIYNLKGNSTQGGIWLQQSCNVKLYHNTIVLDDTTPAGNLRSSNAIVSFDSSTIADVKNNNIYISRPGQKHAIRWSDSLQKLTSAHNNYFLTGSGPSAVGLVYQGNSPATQYQTLAAWQALGQDVNSVTIDPVFLSPSTGDYTPTSIPLNDLGTPAGIAYDINTQLRSTTTPDIGAYEFSLVPCDTPALSLASVGYTKATVSWTSMPNAIGYDYAVTTSPASPGAGTMLTGTSFNAKNLTPGTIYYFYLRTNCGSNKSSWVKIPFTTDTCARPFPVSITSITSDSANIGWPAISGAMGYEYSVTGGTVLPFTGTYIQNNSYTATGLNPFTDYCFHVRTVCDTGVFSAWHTDCFKTTTVNEIGNSGASLSVYPNPATNKLTVEVKGLTNIDARIKLTDVTGKVIKQYEMKTAKALINMTELSQGIYIVHFVDENGSSIVKVMKK